MAINISPLFSEYISHYVRAAAICCESNMYVILVATDESTTARSQIRALK